MKLHRPLTCGLTALIILWSNSAASSEERWETHGRAGQAFFGNHVTLSDSRIILQNGQIIRIVPDGEAEIFDTIFHTKVNARLYKVESGQTIRTIDGAKFPCGATTGIASVGYIAIWKPANPRRVSWEADLEMAIFSDSSVPTVESLHCQIGFTNFNHKVGGR